ncbi:MAG: phosphonate ABC transporter substrate-binding protein [Rhizobiales bacterium 32-66-8]|nr:MAG: phosphonate ABC transporter substrate-binding protein [Rhizobiales bacterium 32-66-8]
MPQEAIFGLDRRIFLARLGSFVASLAALPRISKAKPSDIRFGLTPVFLTSDLELLGRLQAYLARATGFPISLITRRTYQEIVALLISRQIDAAWICGYPYVMHATELQLVALPRWRGRPLYQSYLIVDADRQAESLSDLKGDVHAFSDPDSNSGFLVTRAALAEAQFRPETFFERTFFTYGHRNVIRAVASGLATSGSVDGYVYELVAELEPALAARTRILQRSEWLGFPPIAAPRIAVDNARLERLSAALLSMAMDDDGRAILAMLRLDGFGREDVDLFDPIAAKAAIVALAG